MALPVRSRERPEKILVAMLELSGGTTKPLKYEDIVVRAFERFPDEFALRGYPQYPDSSDIHKPLYGVLKRGGYVRSGNKKFALTAYGVDRATKLTAAAGDRLNGERDARRMTRDVQQEVERMAKSEAYRLFLNEQQAKILDTDFYDFLGCTVRTPRNDFLGRLAIVRDAVQTAAALGQPDKETADTLPKVWAYLLATFQAQIARRQSNGR